MSKAEMSRQIDIEPQSYNKRVIERNDKLSLRELTKISAALGITFGELMFDATPLPTVPAYKDLVRDFLLPKVPPSEFFPYFDELAAKALPEECKANGVTQEALLRIAAKEGAFAFMLTEKIIDMTVLRAWVSAYILNRTITLAGQP